MKALLFANTEWYLYNFRLSLARALQAAGYVFTSRSIKPLVLRPMVRLALRVALGGKRAASDPFRIVLPARLLWDKGIAEWVIAAEKCNDTWVSAHLMTLMPGVHWVPRSPMTDAAVQFVEADHGIAAIKPFKRGVISDKSGGAGE